MDCGSFKRAHVTIGVVVCGVLACGLWLVSREDNTLRTEGAREPVQSGRVDRAPANEAYAVSVAVLPALLDTLVQLRREGQNDAAELHRSEIVTLLTKTLPRDGESLQARGKAVFGRIPGAFDEFDRTRSGESRVIHDFCFLGSVEMGVERRQHELGCACLEDLIAWGPPRDHRDGDPHHAECRAILYLVKAAFTGEGTLRLATRLIESDWVASCPILAGYAVSLCDGPLAGRVSERLMWLLQNSDKARLIWEAARALARAGRLDLIISALLDPSVRNPIPILSGCVEALPLDDAERLLKDLRGRAYGKGVRGVRLMDAVGHGYAVWGKRSMQETQRGIHGLVEKLLGELADRPASPSPVDRTTLMSAITGGCALFMIEGKPIPRNTDEQMTEWRERIETLLADRARDSYDNRRSYTSELWALGYCSATAERYLKTARAVLESRGGKRAIVDVTAGLTALSRRGLLTEGNRTAAMTMAKGMISEARTYGQKDALLNFVEVANAVELVSTFDEWAKRPSKREQEDWTKLKARVQALEAAAKAER